MSGQSGSAEDAPAPVTEWPVPAGRAGLRIGRGISPAPRRFAPNTAAQAAAFIRAEMPKWAQAVRESGAEAD